MATIQEKTLVDGTRRYRCLVRLRGYPPQTKSFRRKTDAKRWGKQTEAAIVEGRYFKAEALRKRTLTDLVDRYIRDIVPIKKSRRRRVHHLNWWKTQLGAYMLADISPALLAEQRDRLLAGVTFSGVRRGPATTVRYMASLSHAFSVAASEWGWMASNPLRNVRRPSEPRGRVRFLDEAERTALLEACRTSRNETLYPLVVLALGTGMRAGELLSLRWKDVDFKRGRITLEHTKNGERRVVPLVAVPAVVLKSHRHRLQPQDEGPVFPAQSDPGRSIFPRSAWEGAVRAAELKNFRFHDLRHSAASYLAMSGATMMEIADVLGHKTLQMVRRYAHLSDAHTTGVVERMNQAVFL